MKELDGKSCLYERGKYACGILKIKDCEKCKFKVANTKSNYQKYIIDVEKAIDEYKAKHFN